MNARRHPSFLHYLSNYSLYIKEESLSNTDVALVNKDLGEKTFLHMVFQTAWAVNFSMTLFGRKPTGDGCQGREVRSLLFTVGSTAVVKTDFIFGTNAQENIAIKLEYNTDLDVCLTTFIREERLWKQTFISLLLLNLSRAWHGTKLRITTLIFTDQTGLFDYSYTILHQNNTL